MFSKAIVFGDIHFGEKQNSVVHNQDCIDYLNWLVTLAREQGITDCIFLGDWHHNRYTINTSTLQSSVEGLCILNDYFENTWFIEGNHDLLYRSSREISSVSFTKGFSNIHLIESITTFGEPGNEVALVPWLVEDEWKTLKGSSFKYVFGHFELPTFYMNAMVRKPDNGKLKKDELTNNGYVFSGHFHKRQVQGNIEYIGSPFGHNFNDVDDKDRGCMVLEWDKPPVYHNWDEAPIYRRYDIKDIIADPLTVIGNDVKIYAELFYGKDTTFSKASAVKEELLEKYPFRKISLKGYQSSVSGEGEKIEAKTVDSVSKIVVEQLNTIDSPSYDKNLLIEEYESLDSFEK